MKMYFKRSYGIVNILLLITVAAGCNKKSSEQSVGEEVKSNPSVVIEGAKLTKISEGYTFDTAGSPLYFKGYYYFTNNNFDQPEKSMTLRMSPSAKIDTLMVDNGVTTTLQAGGSNTMYACEMLGHRVVELNREGELIRVVADKYNGRRIDGPNDIVVDDKGGFYFSDSQFIAGGEKMQETPAVYYVTPEDTIIRVIDDIEFPNGMGLSPDGSILYVANTRGKYLLAYDVNEDGTLSNKRNFTHMEIPVDGQESGADGMAVDAEGNVYVATTQGIGVQVFDRKGSHLQNIDAPTVTNNVSFGGEQGTQILIAAQDGIYAIEGKYPGRRFSP